MADGKTLYQRPAAAESGRPNLNFSFGEDDRERRVNWAHYVLAPARQILRRG